MTTPKLLLAIRDLEKIEDELIDAIDDGDMGIFDLANVVRAYKAANRVISALPSLVAEFITMSPSEWEAIILGFQPVFEKGERLVGLIEAMQIDKPRSRTVAEQTVLTPEEMEDQD